MNAPNIVAMRPNVTQTEAVREFSRNGVSSWYWRATAGSLQRIAQVYVPYQFYEVSFAMARVPYTRFFAIDAVNGSLDLFEFAQIPSAERLSRVNTRNCIGQSLPTGRTDELLREKALRVIFQRGFFKVSESSVKFSRLPEIVHFPYWLGFYAHDDIVRCRVMDALRRRIEGPKATALFEQWLAA
jgi:hypothetical protein